MAACPRCPAWPRRREPSSTASSAGYPALPEHGEPDFISLALLGGQAGPVGTLILAERAIARPVLGG